MAIVDTRHADILLKDGGGNNIYLKLGEGSLKWTESRNLKYTTDRGRLDEVILEEPTPLSVDFDSTWMQAGAPQTNHYADGTKTTSILPADFVRGILEGGELMGESVVSITQTAGLATVTDTGHGLVVSGTVTIAGADQTEYNGVQAVTVVDANTYTYAVDVGAVSPATGTISARKVVATFVSSDPDAERPHACDIEVKYKTDATNETTILLKDFRYESISSDLSAGTFATSGNCFGTEALFTEAAV